MYVKSFDEIPLQAIGGHTHIQWTKISNMSVTLWISVASKTVIIHCADRNKKTTVMIENIPYIFTMKTFIIKNLMYQKRVLILQKGKIVRNPNVLIALFSRIRL